MNNTSLYIKTNYSLLSSLISIDSLIDMAIKNKLNTLSICDDNLTSTMIFYNKCINNGIKPVIGLDVKYNNTNILLYAKDYDGYKNLIKLSTIMSEREVTIDDIEKYNNNLICIVPFSSIELYNEIHNLYDDIYIGVGNSIEEKESKKISSKLVFINKVLYLKKQYSEYLKYLFMIRDGKTISDDISFKDNYNYPLFDNAYNLVSKGTVDNIYVILKKCNLKIEKRNDLLPVFDDSVDGDEYLKSLSIKGLTKRLNDNVSLNYKNRLFYELDIIKKMGFSNYFLVVYDFIRYAKKNKILVGPGRGSAAGSLVAYSLGITDVDPLKYDLLFERFLNPQRVTMPDIDTDFPDIYRQDVIDYVTKKYGEKRVSGIITFGTMAPKLVLRDVGRVLNVPIKTIDSLCKHIPNVTKQKLKDFYMENEDFKNIIDSSDKLTLLYNISNLIEGFPRHTSIHAAGIVMSRIDLDEVIPLVKSDDSYISAYSMEYLEELGLLKMDFLGIKNLTTIMNIISDIKIHENIDVDFSSIPLDDEETIELFKNADTCGIFQFESDGMKNFLKKLKPTSLNDIFAAIALFRPGPAVNIDSYIRRKHNIESVEYISTSLEKILAPTYGIIIYQEQIMQIANVMAGFSLGEADILRRAMSKKKLDLLKSEEKKFIDGSISNGYSKEIAEKVFNLILNFANYGFNKSHSVCYSIIAYKMAYLKVKYPKYFFANLLSSVINNESKTLEYIKEARKLGIKILLPNINRSTNKYEVDDDGILFPISNIRNVGSAISSYILANRTSPFTDIYDCFSKIVSRNVNKSVIESLINSSCFDEFGYNKATLNYNLDNLINYATLTKEIDSEFVMKPDIELRDEYSKDLLLDLEKQSLGIYLSDHPTVIYKSKLDGKYKNVNEINKNFNKTVGLVVLIEKIKIINTKNNDKMAFALSSDETGSCDLTFFPTQYEKYKDIINKGDVIYITGQVQRRFDKYQVVVQNVNKI